MSIKDFFQPFKNRISDEDGVRIVEAKDLDAGMHLARCHGLTDYRYCGEIVEEILTTTRKNCVKFRTTKGVFTESKSAPVLIANKSKNL